MVYLLLAKLNLQRSFYFGQLCTTDRAAPNEFLPITPSSNLLFLINTNEIGKKRQRKST
ncbi:hypothetical protein [Spirosoma pomorum]